jgi:hypothetical protein
MTLGVGSTLDLIHRVRGKAMIVASNYCFDTRCDLAVGVDLCVGGSDIDHCKSFVKVVHLPEVEYCFEVVILISVRVDDFTSETCTVFAPFVVSESIGITEVSNPSSIHLFECRGGK